jgi:hypothetical protein
MDRGLTLATTAMLFRLLSLKTRREPARVGLWHRKRKAAAIAESRACYHFATQLPATCGDVAGSSGRLTVKNYRYQPLNRMCGQEQARALTNSKTGG